MDIDSLLRVGLLVAVVAQFIAFVTGKWTWMRYIGMLFGIAAIINDV